MKTKAGRASFFLMHLGFLLYSGYAVLGKIASRQDFLSAPFLALYIAVFFVMFLYAIIWQQVLKKISLSFAIANKAITIVWGIMFGRLLFAERITGNMIFGAVIILAGILLLGVSTSQGTRDA